MTRFTHSASIIALALACAQNSYGQDASSTEDTGSRLGTITVTATKRSASAQSIPVAVNAIGEAALEELGVKNFTDYLLQLPGVTAGGSGPGQNTIYIRGLASTTPNLTTAGVAGLAPNVAFYLDEQPLAQPGRNLDVYTADLVRVEVLSGPQGTLFGASSQAGTVRLITNKPDFSGVDASFKAGTSFTEGGKSSTNFEAMLNMPVNDKLALRGVVYSDRQGGYIDNVPGTRNAGEGAGLSTGGFYDRGGLANVTLVEATNTNLVSEDTNSTKYEGFRVSGSYLINDDWSLLVSRAQQTIESDGVFFADPELDDYQIKRFSPDQTEDEFENTSWTLEGRLGALEAIYTGAYTERTTDQTVDYTDYLFVAQYLPYYICDATVTYPASGSTPAGTCQAPNLFVDSSTDTTVQTHELRFNTPSENRLRATFGAFMSDLELKELNFFTYPGSQLAIGFSGQTGFAPNYPLTNTAVTGEIGNASPGYFSAPGPYGDGIIFFNDILRTDKQEGMFGEATYDISDAFSVTLGARWYNIEVDFEGSANSSFFNFGQTADTQGAGANISAQFAPDNTVGAPDKAKTDGVIFKFTGNWTPNDDMLFFATYSEGFRPGFLNRPGGRTNDAGTYTIPYAFDTDEVKNYELGWKTELFDNSLRFNGSAFLVDISNLQVNVFDPSITNLFFSDNAANAEIKGVEGNFTWAPIQIDGLTVNGAFSLLDTEVTDILIDSDFVKVGADLAFAPAYQGNLNVRYEWDLGYEIDGQPLTAHFMPQLAISDSSNVDVVTVKNFEIDGWTTLGATLGVSADNWSAELFATNLTNEYAILSGNKTFDRERVTPIRPRTIGVRIAYDF